MRIERTLPFVTTLGPGKRLVIWTNGCPRKCVGCVSERLQVINEAKEVDVDSYFLDYDLSVYDGVTISGGDPFMQEEELYKLLTLFKKRGVKDILIYTGYLLEEIKEDKAKSKCLPYIDVLIDGPYVDSLNDDTDNIKGSSNQRIFFFNEELKDKYLAYMKSERKMEEFRYGNYLVGVGIPTRKYIKDFKKGGN